MKKILLIAVLLLIFPVSAHAHSGLSSSTPAEGEMLVGSPAEIQFQFESPIQQGDMTLTDESGNTVEFSGISFSDLELLGQLDEELPNGAYTVDWSALSQDGHEITGTLIFNVAVEASDEQASEDTTETKETEAAALSADEQGEEAAATAVEPAKAETPWVTIIIIAVLIMAAAAFYVMARRK